MLETRRLPILWATSSVTRRVGPAYLLPDRWKSAMKMKSGSISRPMRMGVCSAGRIVATFLRLRNPRSEVRPRRVRVHGNAAQIQSIEGWLQLGRYLVTLQVMSERSTGWIDGRRDGYSCRSDTCTGRTFTDCRSLSNSWIRMQQN